MDSHCAIFHVYFSQVITIEPGSIVALTADGQGVHCVVKHANKLVLKSFNVCSGKVELESKELDHKSISDFHLNMYLQV